MGGGSSSSGGGGGGGGGGGTLIFTAGPGTGVSPFIGFLHHLHVLQQQQQQQQRPPGLAFLFFGCRSNSDFLFKSQLEDFVGQDVMKQFWVAYSRPEETQAKAATDADADAADAAAAASAAAALSLDGRGGGERRGQYVQDVIAEQKQVTCDV
jgi:sulfite reductase alpha subunit-like flavoprotein